MQRPTTTNRTLNKGGSQTHQEFARQLKRNGNKWLERRGAQSTQQIKEVMILEQLTLKLAPEIREWLADHKPQSIEEAARLDDEYVAS